jgi:hypothetical protein
MFRKYILPAALILVLASTACSGGELTTTSAELPERDAGSIPNQENGDSQEDGVDQDLGQFPPQPNPVDLEITLDEESAVGKEIGPDGGSLEAVGADGTRYLLEVPPQALFSLVNIHLTPAVSVSGNPISGETSGLVQLQPEGLVFSEPAVLSIFPAAASQTGETVAFGSRGQGEDFHLYPEEEIDGGVKLRINHFSGFGTLDAPLERVEKGYVPSSAETYAHDQQATIINYVDGVNTQLDALEKIQREWYVHSVEINLVDASLNADLIEKAIGEFISWRSDIKSLDALVDTDGELESRLNDLIERGLDAAATALKFGMDDAYSICVTEQKPEVALRIARYILLAWDLDVFGRSGLNIEDGNQKVATCFQFEFIFTSYIEGETDNNIKVSEVEAVVPFKIVEPGSFTRSGGSLTNTAPLKFTINQIVPEPDQCFVDSNQGLLEVDFRLDFNFYLVDPKAELIIAALNIADAPEEKAVCPVTEDQSVELPLLFWRPVFQVGLGSLFEGSDLIIIMPIIREGATFAEFEISGFPETNGFTEPFNGEHRSSFQLIHTPGKYDQ